MFMVLSIITQVIARVDAMLCSVRITWGGDADDTRVQVDWQVRDAHENREADGAAATNLSAVEERSHPVSLWNARCLRSKRGKRE